MSRATLMRYSLLIRSLRAMRPGSRCFEKTEKAAYTRCTFTRIRVRLGGQRRIL